MSEEKKDCCLVCPDYCNGFEFRHLENFKFDYDNSYWGDDEPFLFGSDPDIIKQRIEIILKEQRAVDLIGLLECVSDLLYDIEGFICGLKIPEYEDEKNEAIAKELRKTLEDYRSYFLQSCNGYYREKEK